MKKVIILILALFISYNVSFASDCKEEVIKNAINPILLKDGKSFAYISLNDDGTKSVVLNGVKSKESYVDIWNLTFSESGKNFAYVGEDKNIDRFIIKNGVKYTDSYNYIRDLSFVGENTLVYIAKIGDKEFIFKDKNKISDGFIGNKINNLNFTKDGKNYLYLLGNDDGTFDIIKNNKKIKSNEKIKNINNFISDGNNYTYIRQNNDGKEIIVINGEISKESFSNISNLTYSENKKVFGYRGLNEKGKYIVIINGIKDNISFKDTSNLVILNNGDYIYLGVDDDGKIYKIKNGKKIEDLTFTYNNKLIDGVDITSKYESLKGSIKISNDGNSYAYITKDNNGLLIIKDGKIITDSVPYIRALADGEIIGLISLKSYADLHTSILFLTYSKKGNSFSYVINKDGKWIVIKDGKELTKYGAITKDGLNYSVNDDYMYYSINDDYMYYSINDNYGGKREQLIIKTCNNNINNKIVDEKEVERRKYVSMYIQAKLSLIGTNNDYTNKIDTLVTKYDNIKLEKLFNKVKNIQNKNNILKYLEAKIYLKLNNKEVEEFNQSTDENVQYATAIPKYDTSNKNAKTILEKYGFSGISDLVKSEDMENMLKQQLVIAILGEYHIKGYKYLKDNTQAYKEYLKGLEEIEEYKNNI